MKPKSKREKGKRFEKLIAREIEEAGLGKASREIGSGSGKRKGDIFSSIPYLIECKNQKQIRILDWIDQAKREAEEGSWDRYKWALVFRDPRTPEKDPEIYAVIDFWQWLELLKKDQEPLIKEPDRELKYLLEKLKYFTQQVIKRL
ncbi:MAG: hypothetical protein J7L39_03215 [Candidatus Aenigmarchaeota archaeon]|nr:hypothetical protein [Candidatus Aenigmarchaeota archaeon]